MKPFLPFALALALAAPSASGEPKMSAGQVSRIGELVIRAKQHDEYLGMFSTEDPAFDPKSGVWRLQMTPKAFPVTCGSLLYFCEIRDSDAHFRIGAISGSGFRPKSQRTFRMSPSLRQKIDRVRGGSRRKTTPKSIANQSSY
jgi:hypothetical protein